MPHHIFYVLPYLSFFTLERKEGNMPKQDIVNPKTANNTVVTILETPTVIVPPLNFEGGSNTTLDKR